MAAKPWFKVFAGDYLMDDKLDGIPREAEGLLVRMWAICWIEGSCPDNQETVARKTRCAADYVACHWNECLPFFQKIGDRLYSMRMEKERSKSTTASNNVASRYAARREPGLVQEPVQGSLQSVGHSVEGKSGENLLRIVLPRSDYDSDFSTCSSMNNKAIRLPKDFRPTDQHRQLARELGVDLPLEFDKFRDHFMSAPGQKGVKLDWDATFRNWIRNSINYSKAGKGVGASVKTGAFHRSGALDYANGADAVFSNRPGPKVQKLQ